jgi:hypothetical protein
MPLISMLVLSSFLISRRPRDFGRHRPSSGPPPNPPHPCPLIHDHERSRRVGAPKRLLPPQPSRRYRSTSSRLGARNQVYLLCRPIPLSLSSSSLHQTPPAPPITGKAATTTIPFLFGKPHGSRAPSDSAAAPPNPLLLADASQVLPASFCPHPSPRKTTSPISRRGRPEPGGGAEI